MQKSLFTKYFTVCLLHHPASASPSSGVVLMVFASQYFKKDKYDLLENNARSAAAG